MANHFRIVESEGLTDGEEQLEAIAEDVAAEPLPDLETPAEASGLIELPTIEQPASPSFTVPSVTDEPAVAPEPEPELPPMVDPLYAPLAAEEEQPIDRSGNPTISFRNVSLIYPSRPDKKALDDVSLDIYPGEFVFVVGHSGSGKSSLLRLITRELKATSGQVIVAGQDLTKLRNGKVPYLRRQIGCVFQDFKLLPDKTC